MRAFGECLDGAGAPGSSGLAAAVTAFADRIVQLGKAEIGDKTMVDALLPFTETLGRLVLGGAPAGMAWEEAARQATAAAEATAGLLPLKGRARPLAEKSLGTATSLAMIFTVMGPHLTAAATGPAARESVGAQS